MAFVRGEMVTKPKSVERERGRDDENGSIKSQNETDRGNLSELMKGEAGGCKRERG